MSQQQLSEISGIAQSNISAIENNRREPSASTLHQLLIACGYQLIANGGSRSVPIPVEPLDHEGDFGLEIEPPARTASERNRRLMSVLAIADATRASKRNRT